MQVFGLGADRCNIAAGRPNRKIEILFDCIQVLLMVMPTLSAPR